MIFSSRGSQVVAVEAESGKRLWARTIEGVVNTRLVSREDRIYVGTLEGGMFRIDAATGEVTARHAFDGTLYGRPVPVGDSVLVLLDGDKLASIDADLTRVRWTRQADQHISVFKRPTTEAILSGIQGLVKALRDSPLLTNTDQHNPITAATKSAPRSMRLTEGALLGRPGLVRAGLRGRRAERVRRDGAWS